MRTPPQDDKDGLSLLEVLFALGLLAALAAYLYPNYMRGVTRRSLINCKYNLKNIGTALEMYSTHWNGHYPSSMALLTPKYLKTIPDCRSVGKDTYSATYKLHDWKYIDVRCPEHGLPEDKENPDKTPGPCKDIALQLTEELKQKEDIPEDLSEFPKELTHCPSGPLLEHVGNAPYYWISCGGPNHASVATPAGFPQYNGLVGLIER